MFLDTLCWDRQGRAGQKGYAYTLLTRDDERYVPDIIKGFKSSKQEIPPELEQLANSYAYKVNAGLLHDGPNQGYNTKG